MVLVIFGESYKHFNICLFAERLTGGQSNALPLWLAFQNAASSVTKMYKGKVQISTFTAFHLLTFLL